MRIQRFARIAAAAALAIAGGIVGALPAVAHAQAAVPVAASPAAPAAAASSEARSAAAKAGRRTQLRFVSPEAAVSALVQAARAEDRERVLAVLGAGGRRVVDSGDPQIDAEARVRLLAAYERGHIIEAENERRATLLLGENQWPLPFPLVKDQDGRWRFDTAAGVKEYLDRQVGQNELDVLKVMDAYVQAQIEYAQRDYTANGLLEYAQRIVSSEGQRDGLYWPVAAGEPPSPIGARFALAALGRWRGTDDAPQPFHGYYFRPLTAQGPHAPGGAYDYIVKGHQIGGFALLAWPAQWGVSGIMTFIVNHDGVVYSRNFGPQTPQRIQRIQRFDPGPGWKREAPAP
jgi:hypothetical protein